jgi:hypothetical protein
LARIARRRRSRRKPCGACASGSAEETTDDSYTSQR